MGGSPKPPKPPDPEKTASAQTSENISTAIANAYLGNVNQETPEGSLSYDQTGTFNYTDPLSGKAYDIPRFTARQELSPGQQQLYDTGLRTQQNIAGIGEEQSGRIRSHLGTPVDLSNDAVEGRLFELGRKRLDPALAESEETLRTRLANQGIQQDSAAFDRAMRQFNQGRNDAYNQLLLKGRGQAVQETLTARNQPINEITALLSGSQVSQPNFVPTNMPQAPTTDYAGIVGQNYNQRLGAYQMEQQNNPFRNVMGGLFQLGGGALAGGYI